MIEGSGLSPSLVLLARDIAAETGVSFNDVLTEAARDGLEAMRPRWEKRRQKARERLQPA